ncbi:MAG TPA: HIT family protein [Dehalococcoidia bacterium]|nr:HIT family protein [Dehalococcoidia bacterium]
MTTREDCLMCQDPLFTDRGFNQFQKIADLDVSTAILNRDWQFYRGSTLLVFQSHVTELHHLTPNLQHRFMADACRMAEALVKTFQPLKINHALLGNAVPHLHWHLIPRYQSDPFPTYAIWEHEFPKSPPSDQEFMDIAEQIRVNL